MKLKELKDKLVALLKDARDVADLAVTEERELTADERQKVTGLMGEARGVREDIGKLQKDADLIKEINGLLDGVELKDPTADRVDRYLQGLRNPAGEGKSLGEQFLNSDEFKNWFKSAAPSGHLPQGAKIASPSIGFKTLLTGGGSGSAGELVYPERLGLVPLGRRPLNLRDIITVGTTSSDSIEFAAILAETNAAAPVAEATATAGASGTKPESAFTFEPRTATAKTIAHWIPATRRALSDAGQLRTLIDNFLEDGLNQVVEDEIAAGDGTGEHFDGFGHVSGTQSQAWDTDVFKTTRVARRKVRTVGRANPTAYVLNPVDWETIQLTQNDNGDYYYGGPASNGPQMLWQLPVVENEAIPEGTGYVGDWRECVLLDREQATISVSDSHADFFIRNMVAILAELRAIFFVRKPVAIVEIDLTA